MLGFKGTTCEKNGSSRNENAKMDVRLYNKREYGMPLYERRLV